MKKRFSRVVTANLGTKLISILVAGVLWSVVLGSRTEEVSKEIALEILTSPEVIAANDLPDRISFRLAGPKAFLRSILNRREEPIRINLVGTSPGLVTHRFFSDSIRVPIGVKVVSVSPAALLIRLEELQHKEVAIRAEIRGAPRTGYRVVGFEAIPPVFRVRGAESKRKGVTEVASFPVDITGMTETVEKDLSLDLGRLGILADQDPPRIRIQIEEDSDQARHRKPR